MTSFETPTDLTFVVTRVFDAPRPVVFDAWTKPEHVSQWLLGPDGWSMPVCEIDLRVGGAWRYVWRNDADGTEFGMSGVYTEVAPPERVVHTERMTPDLPETTNVLALEEVGGKTKVTLTVVYASKELRDMAIATGMSDGIAVSYDRLDGYLRESA